MYLISGSSWLDIDRPFVITIQFWFRSKRLMAPDIATTYFTVSITALQREQHKI